MEASPDTTTAALPADQPIDKYDAMVAYLKVCLSSFLLHFLLPSCLPAVLPSYIFYLSLSPLPIAEDPSVRRYSRHRIKT
jgi:hypothetical protein